MGIFNMTRRQGQPADNPDAPAAPPAREGRFDALRRHCGEALRSISGARPGLEAQEQARAASQSMYPLQRDDRPPPRSVSLQSNGEPWPGSPTPETGYGSSGTYRYPLMGRITGGEGSLAGPSASAMLPNRQWASGSGGGPRVTMPPELGNGGGNGGRIMGTGGTLHSASEDRFVGKGGQHGRRW